MTTLTVNRPEPVAVDDGATVQTTAHTLAGWEGDVAVALCGFRKVPEWIDPNRQRADCVVCAELEAQGPATPA